MFLLQFSEDVVEKSQVPPFCSSFVTLLVFVFTPLRPQISEQSLQLLQALISQSTTKINQNVGNHLDKALCCTL